MTDDLRSASDAGGVVGADVVSACALSAVPGLGASTLLKIVRAFGSLSDALEAGPQQIVARAAELKLRQDARDFLLREPDLRELGLWAVAAARAAGARIVLFGDAWFPPLLREIENPPVLLYVRGALEPRAPRIAVVGARDSDDYGLEIARQMAEGFARARVQVVSGGARGVDGAAHAGALWGGGTTVAVLGTGIDVTYPPEHGELYERLATGGGAVVSELTPGTRPQPANFPRRNRIISGLSSAVVVVRAALRSGALSTADHAARQERPIFAVPGDATSRLSAGPNELLRLGAARSATSPRDVLLGLEWKLPRELEQPPEPPGPAFPDRTDPAAAASRTDARVIDEGALRLWRLLDPKKPQHIDELSARSGLAAQETLRKLVDLELRGLCVQRPGKYFLRKEP